MQNLAGKTAIVTGGASGIGLGISRALLGAGMNVAIGDVQEDALRRAGEELGRPDRLLALRLDVTDRDGYARFADAVEARFGHLHLLVNNAGVVVSGPIDRAAFSDWDWVLGVNLGGVVNGIVTCLPRILAHGEGGHIVNTASTSGLLPHPGAVIYTTSKSALIGMSEALRAELEPQGVVVSAFCPGPVQSQIGNAGRNRPDSFGETGYASDASPPPTAEEAEMALQAMMPAEEVGEIVRRGIEHDLLYIFTHGEYREGLEQRAGAIQSALPCGPENPVLKQMMAVTMSNPAHAAEIERQRELRAATTGDKV